MPTLVVHYGLAAPHVGADAVQEQIRLAHAYRRRLVEIERARRAQARTAEASASAEVRAAEEAAAAADAEVERLASEIRALRKAARARVETAEARARLKAAREAKRAALRALYNARERVRSRCAACRKSNVNPCPHASAEARALRAALDVIDLTANEAHKAARAASGVYWGTYLLVEAAHRKSAGAPLYEPDGVTPHDPPWPRWDGGGAIGVQIQTTRPLAAEGIDGEDTRVQVSHAPWPEAWLEAHPVSDDPGPPHRRNKGWRPDGTRAETTRPDGRAPWWMRTEAARHAELRLRVSSDESGKPVWAAWRLDEHRRLPPGASIRGVTVHRRMLGPHAVWSAVVTIETTDTIRPVKRPGSTVAIDVGWRVMGDELRVAAWRDSDGHAGELRLSADDLRALGLPEAMQQDRDQRLLAAIARLRAWAKGADLPDALRSEIAHLRSALGLVRLLRRWQTERPADVRDEAEQIAIADVEAWAMVDRHAWGAESVARTSASRRRRDRYRVFAARLAATYETILLEHFDLRAVAARQETGEDKAENETARGNRVRACVSDLRGAILGAVRTTASTVMSLDAADSTRTHAICGVVASRDAAGDVMVFCDACRESFDQDDNAAAVLLARYGERPGDAQILAGAREREESAKEEKKTGSRWAKARALGAAKRARVEAARNAVGNGAE